jgi:branched-chain amino acid transport system substrate-binding protein
MNCLPRAVCGALAALLLGCAVPAARAVEPLVIGFDIGLTGGLAPNGKAALLAMQIWTEETNAKGGLLGRPVRLLYYDDQSNPSTVQGIIT